MEITQTPIAQMLNPGAAATAEPTGDSGFAQTLAAVSGAPPGAQGGPEPPGAAVKVEEEAANLEPIALSQIPDFLPLPELTIDLPPDFWAPAEGGQPAQGAPTKEDKDPGNAEREAAQLGLAAMFAVPVPTPVVVPNAQMAVVANPVVATANGSKPTASLSEPFASAIDITVPPAPPTGTQTFDTPTVAKEVEASAQAIAAVSSTATSGVSNDVPVAKLSSAPAPQPASKGMALELPVGDAIQVDTPKPDATVTKPRTHVEDEAVRQMRESVQTPATVTANPGTPTETEQCPVNEQAAAAVSSMATPQPADAKESPAPSVLEPLAQRPVAAETAQANSDSGSGSFGKQSGASANENAPTPTSKKSETPTMATAQVTPTRAPVEAQDAKPAANPLTRTETTRVIQQIADRMEILAATRPREGVTIHLQPANLGSITMVVKSLGSAVDAQIFASDQDVRQALEANRPQLTQAMDARGFHLTGVSVGSQAPGQQNFDSQMRQNPQQQGQSHSNRQQPSQAQGDTVVMVREEATETRASAVSTRGVDLWI